VKRFLFFANDTYYPCGGWGDFQGAFDTLEEAKAAVDDCAKCSRGPDWWEIVDLEQLRGIDFGSFKRKRC
jgi:hypothetical protein